MELKKMSLSARYGVKDVDNVQERIDKLTDVIVEVQETATKLSLEFKKCKENIAMAFAIIDHLVVIRNEDSKRVNIEYNKIVQLAKSKGFPTHDMFKNLEKKGILPPEWKEIIKQKNKILSRL